MIKKHSELQPLVSVVMPVYNAEKYLHDAVDSILKQTYENFELITINDGSTDGSGAILDQYAAQDPRIIALHRENRGLVATLNESIALAKGVYIARLDSDDVAFLDRLEKQVKILKTHTDVVLVTGCFEIFDEDSEYLYREVIPERHRDINRAMYLRNPIGHSSVMFRKAAFEKVGGYSNAHGPTEDFELWSRLLSEGSFYSLEHAVFKWRVNTKGITSTQNSKQVEIMKNHLQHMWQSIPPTVTRRHELKEAGDYYIRKYKKRGVSMKEIILSDNAQLAVKMIKRGRVLDGIQQLLIVMSIGRSGVKIVTQRMLHIYRGGSQAISRRLKKNINATGVEG